MHVDTARWLGKLAPDAAQRIQRAWRDHVLRGLFYGDLVCFSVF